MYICTLWGADIIKCRRKETLTLFTIIIITASVFILLGGGKTKNLPVPEFDKLDSIIFVNIVNHIGVEMIVIDESQEIESILELLKTAGRMKGKHSISNFPDKDKFTTILFSFESGGNSLRSMYEENDDLYIEQPYDYIYKLEDDNRQLLEDIINNRSKESISLNLKEILKGDF